MEQLSARKLDIEVKKKTTQLNSLAVLYVDNNRPSLTASSSRVRPFIKPTQQATVAHDLFKDGVWDDMIDAQ
ncbi:MAG: hypothetical protein WCF22_01575 [Candidatus Sulfotelmatobacter sp.]